MTISDRGIVFCDDVFFVSFLGRNRGSGSCGGKVDLLWRMLPRPMSPPLEGGARKCRGGREGIGVWLLTHKAPQPTPAPPREGMLPRALSFRWGLKSKAPRLRCLA